MQLVLKKVSGNAIIPLHAILSACGKAMHEKIGLSHWHPFMDINTFQDSMKGKDVYGVYQNNVAIATFNLSTEPRDYYFDALWSNPKERAVYLGQLAIDPNIQGNGVGKWCMQQVVSIAQEMGRKAIRFDALSAHPWLETFYKNLGYSICGIVKPARWDLVCFEKILT